MVKVGRYVQLSDAVSGHALGPHGLPYAALRGVPYAAVLHFLLAAGVIGGVTLVAHAQRQLVYVLGQEARRVKFKGEVAALMTEGAQSVYIDRAALVYGAEVQYHSAAHVLRTHPVAAVPEVFVRLKLSADSGQLALGGEGNEYLAVPFLRLLFSGCRDRVIPASVEIYKRLPAHLRAGVFGKYVVLIELFAPRCKHGCSSLMFFL